MSLIESTVENGIGRLLLNRPAALNAIDGPMFATIGGILERWIDDPTVRAVTVRGAGRAFCAGGDVRYTVESVRSGQRRLIDELYGVEYRIDGLIHRYPKPFVAVVHGACMGGGMGLAMHAAYRLVCEDALLAMPETELGFFPDCGVMWLLARLPGAIGRYLALTGARLSAADACYTGLATHAVRADRAAEVEALLAESTDAPAFRAALDALAPDLPESALATHRAQIDAAFGQPNVAGIVVALEQDPSPWAEATLALLRRMSRGALCMSFELLERERSLSLERSLAIEYEVARRLAWTPEFAEGVRAVILDKDRKPRWNPARIEEVDRTAVRRFLDEAQSPGMTARSVRRVPLPRCPRRNRVSRAGVRLRALRGIRRGRPGRSRRVARRHRFRDARANAREPVRLPRTARCRRRQYRQHLRWNAGGGNRVPKCGCGRSRSRRGPHAQRLWLARFLRSRSGGIWHSARIADGGREPAPVRPDSGVCEMRYDARAHSFGRRSAPSRSSWCRARDDRIDHAQRPTANLHARQRRDDHYKLPAGRYRGASLTSSAGMPPTRIGAGSGAIIVDGDDTPYGARVYVAKDPEGYVWCFGTYRPGTLEPE